MQLYPARMSTFSSGSTQAWAKIGTRHVRKSAFERGTAFPQLLRDRRNDSPLQRLLHADLGFAHGHDFGDRPVATKSLPDANGSLAK
jgi:hypothetical protein